MSFRFYCSHCQQRLSVSSHKRGLDVKCPRCRRVTRVPAQAESDAGGTSAGPATEVTSFPDMSPAGELVYADCASSESGDRNSGAQDRRAGMRQLVTIPRYVLYTQGFLLGAVALVFFVFGMVVGSRSRGEVGPASPQRPVAISGTVFYQGQGDSRSPDVGSVVMLLPTTQRPDEKAPVEGLRPEDPMPEEDHPAVAIVRSVGGDYARADRHGRFRVRATVPGRYYLLVISKHRRRAADRSPRADELARLGRFVLPATQLLGSHQYRWKEVLLRGDQRLDVTF